MIFFKNNITNYLYEMYNPTIDGIETPKVKIPTYTIEEKEEEIVEQEQIQQQYIEETTFETKPSLWQRIKNSKVVRAIRYITKIRIVIQYPEALPEGRGENN